jgi:hypothetical protein
MTELSFPNSQDVTDRRFMPSCADFFLEGAAFDADMDHGLKAGLGVMVQPAGDVPGSQNLQTWDNENPNVIGGAVSMKSGKLNQNSVSINARIPTKMGHHLTMPAR